MNIKRDIRGQTALILIILAAAAMIFFSITLNWGRIAQTKSMVTVAADGGAALLASDAASYGEQGKQTDIQDQNTQTHFWGGGLLALLELIIVIVVCLVFPIVSPILAAVAVVAAAVNLVLQVAVIHPGEISLWNKLQRSQPAQQQFFEGALGGALQSTVSDQGTIDDYLDEDMVAEFGATGGVPNNPISRFAFFYTERQKMLNSAIFNANSPQGGSSPSNLPYTVIYGWVDKTLANYQVLPNSRAYAGGYAHIVKVTAYSPGRAPGAWCDDNGNGASEYPWIQGCLPKVTSSGGSTSTTYTLTQRDGFVYISVTRWDQDHNAILFPNGHTLWQMMYDATNKHSSTTTSALLSQCGNIGITKEGQQALNALGESGTDSQILSNAFMINDNGNGQVDTSSDHGEIRGCLGTVDKLLESGMESHACAQYIASIHGEVPSQGTSPDYTLRFVPCNSQAMPGYTTPPDSF